MPKLRDYITPSSLGSYFGVGFNTPDEQIQIDLGLIDPEFDEAAQDRMLLGRVFEDASLNYFEQKMGITITNRNTETFDFYEGRIRGKVDGMTFINGIKTVVENKISNSQSGRFTEDLGYMFQVQAYMLGTNTQQALLCGMYQGKPIYRLIQRNEEMIDDIKRMADFIVDVLAGLDDFQNYPTDLLLKYSGKTLLPKIESMPEELVGQLDILLSMKEQVKSLSAKIDAIELTLKENYAEGIFETPRLKVTISENVRAGGIDLDALSIEHPEIDYAKYKKPDNKYRTLRISVKKGAK